METISTAAREKIEYMESSLSRFLVLSILAGIFIGFGVMLVFSIAAPLAAVGSPYVKIVMGISFVVVWLYLPALNSSKPE
ncbi:MAG: hypothetical protein ACLFUI_04545 [Halanaerobiales bacterium]